MADLEEPILPTAAANAGHTFMNAFYAAAQIAGKRRQLEEQITKMDMQMGLAEQKHQLDTNKMEMEYGFKTANLNRQYDQMSQTAVFQNRRADDMEEKSNWYMARKDAAANDASSLRRELSTAAEKNPVWSTAFHNDAINIKSKYGSSKEIEDVIKDFNTDISKATTSAHQNAGLAMRAFDTSLGMQSGEGLNKADFNRPESDFKHVGGNVELHERPVSVPGPAGTTAAVRWETMSPSDPLLQKSQAEQDKAGIRRRRTTAENYKNLRDLHKTIMQYGGEELGGKPSAVNALDPSGAGSVMNLDKDKAQEFLQQAGGDKKRARELARQAGYAF